MFILKMRVVSNRRQRNNNSNSRQMHVTFFAIYAGLRPDTETTETTQSVSVRVGVFFNPKDSNNNGDLIRPSSVRGSLTAEKEAAYSLFSASNSRVL